MSFLRQASANLSKLAKDVENSKFVKDVGRAVDKAVKDVEASEVMQNVNRTAHQAVDNIGKSKVVSDMQTGLRENKVLADVTKAAQGASDSVGRAAQKADAMARKEYEKKCIESLKQKFGVAAYDAAAGERWEDVAAAVAVVKAEIDAHEAKIAELDQRILELSRCQVAPASAASIPREDGMGAVDVGDGGSLPTATDGDDLRASTNLGFVSVEGEPVPEPVSAVPVGRPVGEPGETV